MVHIKNVFFLLSFIALFGVWGCTKDHATATSTLSPDDSCWNLFARDSNYRKGKWVETQDAEEMQLGPPDTLWFISDSLMAWSFPCCTPGYLYTHMYFGHCNLFICQSWDSTEQAEGIWYYRTESLDYATNTVTIQFQDGLGYTIDSYKKIP